MTISSNSGPFISLHIHIWPFLRKGENREEEEEEREEKKGKVDFNKWKKGGLEIVKRNPR